MRVTTLERICQVIVKTLKKPAGAVSGESVFSELTDDTGERFSLIRNLDHEFRREFPDYVPGDVFRKGLTLREMAEIIENWIQARQLSEAN